MTEIAGRLLARCVLLAPGRELSPAEIAWDRRGRIVVLRRVHGPRGGRGSGPVLDLCVLPGLIDAHTHLQLEPLQLEPLPLEPGDAPTAFVPWARAVMAQRLQTTRALLRDSAHRAAFVLLAEGVTAVGEIDSSGQSPSALAATGLAGRCYQELTGFDLDRSGAELRVRERRSPGSGTLAAGLSPHAPYSVSAALFRAAAAASRHLAIHCAETPEEQRFLREGVGPFADLLRDLGRLPPGFCAPGMGAVRWLEQLGLLRASTQLVHCQELEPGDDARIAASGCTVVVCPGTMAWFGRQPPPVERWLAQGIPVALGTDSRASNAQWSLRAALQQASGLWPGLSPEQLFRMATTAGARALGLPGLGTLRRGGRADLFAVPAHSDCATDHVEQVLCAGTAPTLVLAAGRRRSPGESLLARSGL